ncbi:helix-turn-helix domain-containing protein [Halomonas sp. ANAO-440]|uniref:helix-turn-helix domain-containing protein n=1 Tax=Halomonas sp. ANAO-440 TaxID=2861360 RepID=UPI0021CD97FD|nr:helix-turn-helix domain-containing protein [Halomonas sp. ANAO-440]
MPHCYRHFTAEDRDAIMMMRTTHSTRAIAAHLGRAPSTVSRELARHTVDASSGYDASLAGYRARLARHRPRQQPKLPGKTHEKLYTARMSARYVSSSATFFCFRRIPPLKPFSPFR